MDNPWLNLPDNPPYILPCDGVAIANFNDRAKPDKKFDLSLFPEPYFGSPEATVVLLALNPGWSPNDAALHSDPDFSEQSRLSRAHSLKPYPFIHLQDKSQKTPGSIWWQRIVGPLIRATSFDVVAKNILCVQFFPYHSISFGSGLLSVPSQQYGFNLVRAAMDRHAEIVVMRSKRLWFSAIPELESYPNLHKAKNPRNPSLSPGNLEGHSFDVLKDRLKNISAE